MSCNEPRITKIGVQDLSIYNPKRIAIYARVSSNKDEALASLAAQIEAYKEYTEQNPDWVLADIYVDEGISGTIDNRPEFMRMLADCEAGKIDLVITKNVSRLSRKAETILRTVHNLSGKEIGIFFEDNKINTLEQDFSPLAIGTYASMAEAESKSASENKKWQIRKYFEDGTPTYFRMLGYEMKNNQLHVIEKEAKIVRQIFQDYLSGMGCTVIAKKLNEAGYRTCNGCQFSPVSISVILANEKYAGEMLLQKKYTPDFLTKKQVKNRGDVPQYLVEESHEAIIAPAVFRKVQEEKARRQKKARSGTLRDATSKKLFTGLITCGCCGKKYIYKCSSSSNAKKPYWSCPTYQNCGKAVCPNRSIPEAIVVKKTLEVLNQKYQLSEPYVADDLDHCLTKELCKTITINPNKTITYNFPDGSEITTSWNHVSRGKSWTEAMRNEARQRRYKQLAMMNRMEV